MKSKMIAFLCLFTPALSFPQIHRPGLLTDDHGVVTKQDLDEDEAGCTEVTDFAHRSGCMSYWQCLSAKNVEVICKRLGPDNSDLSGEYGDFTLRIKDQDETHEYIGRHNGDMAECKAMRREILKVVAHEKIVCVSGDFIDKVGQTSSWIIDRMKSHHGEWSWFQREKSKSK
jgi:hypothetical protein